MAHQSPLAVPSMRIVGFAWTVGGAAMFLAAGSRVLAGWDSQDWPHVLGRVSRSSLVPGEPAAGGFTYYKVNIVYDYSPPFHDGYTHVYRGTSLSFRGFIDASEGSYKLDEARRLTLRYPLGQQVQVYFNPKMPRTSVLRPGEDFGTFGGSLMGLILFLLGTPLFLFGRQIVEGMMTFFCRLFP